MKRSVAALLVILAVSSSGALLSCDKIIEPLADPDGMVGSGLSFKEKLAAVDPDPGDSALMVYGTVFYKGSPQPGAIVILTCGTFGSSFLTDDDGKYEFWCQACPFALCRVQACFKNRCNRGPDCDGGQYEFQSPPTEPSRFDLCIGSGGPCPHADCN